MNRAEICGIKKILNCSSVQQGGLNAWKKMVAKWIKFAGLELQ